MLYIQRFPFLDISLLLSDRFNHSVAWSSFLKSNDSRLKSIRTIEIAFDNLDNSLAALLLFSKGRIPKIEALTISFLNLRKESDWAYRGVARLTTVRALYLESLQGASAAELIRFINSFHSLSTLRIRFFWEVEKVEVKKQPLPYKCSNSSLSHLEIELVPGIATFLDWLIDSPSLVSNLKQFITKLGRPKEVHANCERVGRLLEKCSGTLEEVTMQVPISVTDETISLSELLSIIES